MKFENAPVSELQKILGIPAPAKYVTEVENAVCSKILQPYGAEPYPHDACCSGNRRKPVGHPGCGCLRRLRKGLKNET